LLRTAGATPGRIRRAVAIQAAVVAIPAALAGVPLGTLACRAWVGSLAGHGVVPTAVAFRFSAVAWPAALGVGLGAGVLGALAAAVRPARVRPAVALTETAVPRRTFGPVRTGFGVLLAIGGTVLAVVASALPADQAESLGLLVVLALCVGAGLLGPALLLVLFAGRYGLGLDAPWYLGLLVLVGYVPIPAVLVVVAWLAVGGQVAALAAGRYAPYPSRRERGPRGPIREVVRRTVLAAQRRPRVRAAPPPERLRGEL